MTLNPEWRGRIENWYKKMPSLFYIPLGTLPMEAFFTYDQLLPEQAVKQRFKPVKPGYAWGAKWQYGWFRGKVKLPKEARGERIVVKVGVCGDRTFSSGESAVYVNGVASGAIDRQHDEITLAMNGKPGATYSILAEGYGGHGGTPSHLGPIPHGVEAIPEPPKTQRIVAESSFGIWEEEMYQAYIDVMTLLELRDNIDPESLRVVEIDKALKDFTCVVDLELPRADMMKTVAEGRKILARVLAKKNGSTAPTMYCFGHAHIDVAWLWPLRETESKCMRTFGTQLKLMEEYPEFKFLQSQPHLYWMVKNRYPKMYKRVKESIKKGGFVPDGAMWVEADTNVSSGESLIRQFVHGKRFFKDEFGVDSRFMWLPDVFGYTGALPQIMAGCGVDYFSTQKIFWNFNGGENFPYNSFWWEGIDGTRVFSHFHHDYNGQTSPKHLIGRWKQRVQKDDIDARLYPFGYGDGGGGATRDHLEYLRRAKNLEGCPKVKMTTPETFFKREVKRDVDYPVYVGELYLQLHRGTYTTQARAKKGNRLSEWALRETELWGAAACAVAGYAYPVAQVDELWKLVLLNQFHDIIPGSSIARVYEEAEADYARVIGEAGDVADSAARSFVEKDKDAATVFNSLSWDREALVPLPKGWNGATSESGDPLAVQSVGGALQVRVPNVPSCGWTTIRKGKGNVVSGGAKATKNTLENGEVKVVFNREGEIRSVKDKRTGRELAAAPLNSFRMYKDIPRMWDAWDIDSTYRRNPVDISGPAKLSVVSDGPLVAVLRIEKKIGNSTLVQDVRLRDGSRRVDFATSVDWQEKHKLLKVNFPVDVHANEALHEIQFGHLQRSTHASRQYDMDRFEVCNQKWTALCEENRGVAILNDCKYGVDVETNSINLTLLRSSVAPDMNADQGRQEFTYSLFCWNGSFFDSDVVRESYDLNIPVTLRSGAGGTACLFDLKAPNIVIEAVKPSEDGSGDVIVRLYEAKRTRTDCILNTSLPVKRARETDMLEESGKRLACRDGHIKLHFRPFEIKTIRLGM